MGLAEIRGKPRAFMTIYCACVEALLCLEGLRSAAPGAIPHRGKPSVNHCVPILPGLLRESP
jgi:hypothetical protein